MQSCIMDVRLTAVMSVLPAVLTVKIFDPEASSSFTISGCPFKKTGLIFPLPGAFFGRPHRVDTINDYINVRRKNIYISQVKNLFSRYLYIDGKSKVVVS